MYWYSLVIEQANVTPLLFSCVPPCAPALNFVIAPAWPLWHFLYVPKCRGSHYTFCIIHSLKIRKLLILCYFNSNHYFCLMANTKWCFLLWIPMVQVALGGPLAYHCFPLSNCIRVCDGSIGTDICFHFTTCTSLLKAEAVSMPVCSWLITEVVFGWHCKSSKQALRGHVSPP